MIIKHQVNNQLVPYNFDFPVDCTTLIDAVNLWQETVEKGFEQLKANLIREALLNGGARA